MARKRPRAKTVKPRASLKARASNQRDDEKTDTQSGSRLKRARAVPEKNVEAPESTHVSAEQRIEASKKATEAKLTALRNRVEVFLKASVESHLSVLPDASLLVAVAEILETVPVPTLIAKICKVPRILLIAARRGIKEEPSVGSRGSAALARTLALFAKGADVIIPEDDRAMRTTRSAFHPTEHDSFSRVELEAVQRAGKWALQLLTSCVRGEEEGSVKMGQVQDVVRHGDTARVFVAPRDSLDIVMSRRYTASIIERIKSIVNSNTISNGDKISMIRFVCRRLCCLVDSNSFVPTIEGLLLSIRKIAVPMDSCGKLEGPELLENTFVDCVMGNDERSPFRKLCEDAQLVMVTLSYRAWLVHLEDVESRFRVDGDMSANDEKQIVQTLAAAAAEHASLHWDLMDNVRRTIGNDMEPFSVGLWKKRTFYRAVLSRVIDNMDSSTLCKNSNDEEKRRSPPLFRRFPSGFQQMIRSVSMLANSMSINGQLRIEKTRPAAIALEVICDSLQLNSVSNFPPNSHAVLLCIEGFIEKLCWASGVAVVSKTSEGETSISSEDKETLRNMCVIIAVFEVIRLPGGNCAESKQILKRRTDALQNVLHTICCQRQLPSSRTEEWRLSGLLAMTICGALTGCELTAVGKFYGMLNVCEQRELRRAMQTSFALTNNRRLGRAIQSVTQL